jgi:hypothetical protein
LAGAWGFIGSLPFIVKKFGRFQFQVISKEKPDQVKSTGGRVNPKPFPFRSYGSILNNNSEHKSDDEIISFLGEVGRNNLNRHSGFCKPAIC